MTLNKQWLLVRRPAGWAEESCFRLAEAEVPAPGDGQVVVQIHYLSLDPYMRGRMSEGRSYAPCQPLGEVMQGGTVGAVVASRSLAFQPGDLVLGGGGWQQYHLADAAHLTRLEPRGLPESIFLGPAGMPGVTAWYGLHQLGKPKAGETVLISAAAGAVGSVAGQLAKLAGCRAVGIAGGPEKCRHVVQDLGLDACVDHKAAGFLDDLAAATAQGVDVAFENVGGAVLEAALDRMNPFGRVAICGLIAGYNGQEVPIRNLRRMLDSRLSLLGFIISDHMEHWPRALGELRELVAQGRLRYRETVAQGIESAPRAFLGLLRGENLGKQLVKVA